MKVVSVINYKGGVGKTTLTACLASCLQHKGVNVLLVDLDPQCNLTGEVLPDRLDELYPLGEKSGIGAKTLREWYYALCEGRIENLEELILQDRFRHLSVIPSHLDLLDVDTQLAIRLLGTDIRAVHSDPRAGHRRYYDVLNSLRSQLRAIQKSRAAKGRGFDLVLLDCPPNFNIITQTAIVASSEMLIPVRPNPLSAMGMDHLIRKRGNLVRDFNASAKALGLGGPELTAPRILGVVSMMWKVWKRDTPAKGNESVIRILRKLEGDGVVFFDGIRHNETLFAKNKAPTIPYTTGGGIPHDNVREDIRSTCRKIGEALEVVPPSLEDIMDIMLSPVSMPALNVLPSKTAEEAGTALSDAMRHLSGAVAAQFEQDIEKQLVQFAKTSVKGEGFDEHEETLIYFWGQRGYSSDEVDRKRAEYHKQVRSD